MERSKTRDEIINFVLNSPEEVNSKIAVFIAGMKSRKNPAGTMQGAEMDVYCVVKNASLKKQGG